MARASFKRVLLKLSGEVLAGAQAQALKSDRADYLAYSLKEARGLGVELAVVMGGGNILRGLPASTQGVQRETADYMGMLATVINGLALEDALSREGVEARVLSSLPVEEVAETYSRRRALRHLQEGRVVILVGGTGKPYFSTDTAAALRAAEIKAETLLKATKVDGVYDADPLHQPGARCFSCISYMEFISRRLRVMDTTAVVLCMENKVPIIVFNMTEGGNLKRVLLGEKVGTLVKEEC
ncbi:MAG: uridylate kinase [candidate division Zixibacteria bacterium SM23_81]|nr:MAG: uridylate kinase [candidate division Zixibacteria bacterium SM23_81]